MQSASQLFSVALSITKQYRVFWLFQAIPTAFFCIVGYLTLGGTLIPLLRDTMHFIEAQELDYEFIKQLPDTLTSVLLLGIPVAIGTLVLSLLCRNAIYAMIEPAAQRKRITFRMGMHAAFSTFVHVLALLCVLTVLGSLIDVSGWLLSRIHFPTVLVILVELALSLWMAAAALFAWPALVIGKRSIRQALGESTRLTIRQGRTVIVALVMIGVLQLMFACLFGAVIGIGYYVHWTLGITVGIVLLIAMIPVRAYMHVLYGLLYLNIRPAKQYV